MSKVSLKSAAFFHTSTSAFAKVLAYAMMFDFSEHQKVQDKHSKNRRVIEFEISAKGSEGPQIAPYMEQWWKVKNVKKEWFVKLVASWISFYLWI